ncbi:MAG: AraC family transcriptional regulator [Rikenellaceae bacterium]
MKRNEDLRAGSCGERTIVKYSTTQNSGVGSTKLLRNAIGFVLSGEKFIHDDDRTLRVGKGDLFFLTPGTHYIENVPDSSGFEQIMFYFSPEKIQQVMATLTCNSDMEAVDRGNGVRGVSSSVAVESPSAITKSFFNSVEHLYDLGGFTGGSDFESLKLTELTHVVMSHENNSIKRLLLGSLDKEKAEFERIIYSNLLCDKSIDMLAEECSRSVTSFKKEFKRIFGAPPHQWYLRQRLSYAKMLLNTTRESISQVGIICAFPNTSHFIKLFKRFYGCTPAVYRSTHKMSVNAFCSEQKSDVGVVEMPICAESSDDTFSTQQ